MNLVIAGGPFAIVVYNSTTLVNYGRISAVQFGANPAYALDVVNLRLGGLHGPSDGSIEAPFSALAELQRQGLIRQRPER